MKKDILVYLLAILMLVNCCNDPCYTASDDTNCQTDPSRPDIDGYTFHMTVHPHLDAYWIFTFDDYYNPSPSNSAVRSYFSQNIFNSVREIFNTALSTLNASKNWRQAHGEVHQKAHRSFMNSEMGFFKHWYTTELKSEERRTLKQVLNTRFWEILGGGFVEHDEAGAYYDDIIDNFQIGLHWLKQQFGYLPKVAISADSFGHSQSNAAILSQIGIEGSLVQRSDEHILTKNKTEFIWKAKSSNNITYGVIPTVIRWAIHGFEDQFRSGPKGNSFCTSKARFIDNLKRQNKFLKNLFNSSHILRYFGHDFQQFNEYSYEVIEAIMKKFSKQKCNKVIATYSNPTEYFERTLQQVYGKKVRQFQFRQEDIMPIWDYDSGLYWTGYYTTDPYHKKIYKDAGRFAQLSRKLFASLYLQNPNSQQNKDAYDALQRFEQNVAYLQHHDGVTGTSKYTVMDHYQKLTLGLTKELQNKLVRKAFQANYPVIPNSTYIFSCYLDQQCNIPKTQADSIHLKVFNSGGQKTGQIKINLLYAEYFETASCPSETICMCFDLPCACTLYLYPQLSTFNEFVLRRVKEPHNPYLLKDLNSSSFVKVEKQSIVISYESKNYEISYKKIIAQPTPRNYDHLNREGKFNRRSFMIRSGKYALGNNPNKIQVLSGIRQASLVQTPTLSVLIVNWNRQGMKTVITFNNSDKSIFKIDTISSAQIPHIADYYLSVKTPIKNNKQFYTDSNGWLVVKRTLFHHEDYEAHFDPKKYDDIDGNSYPVNAFVYIKDETSKVSVNVDRPEGVIVYEQGDIWLNFDRLTTDDGKWVYETTYRSEYMKYSHVVSIQKSNEYKERLVQKQRDQGLYIQGDSLNHNQNISTTKPLVDIRKQWSELSNINNIKFNVKTWNDSTLLLRLHNLHDQKEEKVTLFAVGTDPNTITSVFLTSYYGRQLIGDKIEEMSLAGNLKYQDFINNKWNLNKFTNLSEEYNIFTKDFGENITLKPLEIRTFLINKPRFSQTCQNVSLLKYSNISKHYSLDLNKNFHKVPENVLEQKAKNYLLHQNHCDLEYNVQKFTDSLPPNYDYIQSTNKISYKYNETYHPQEQKPIDTKPENQTQQKQQPSQKQQPKNQTDTKQPSQRQNTKMLYSIPYILEQVNSKKLLNSEQKRIYFTHRMLNIEVLENCHK